jgi:hypothetical protein
MEAASNAKRCEAITFAFSKKREASTRRKASQAAAHLTMRLDITRTAFVGGFAAAACLIIGMCAANAQASRTWVSAFGHDFNPCTRTAPCRTFAGAIAKTAAGGEIDVLDAGDFGVVTITKALTIDGGGGQVASIQAQDDGVTAQAGPNDVVTLRNLRIKGLDRRFSRFGINFLSGAAIHVQNCYIFGFSSGFSEAAGIYIAGAGRAHISDTIVSNNYDGIRIDTRGPGRVLVTLLRVQMNHSFIGLLASADGGQVSVSVTHSQAARNVSGIVAGGGNFSTDVIINRSTIVNSDWEGLATEPGPAPGVIVVGNSTIAGNGTGVDATRGGTVLTNGNNSLVGNFVSAGTFSGPAPLQ